MTEFADAHPGGQEILYKHIGKDCTAEFYNKVSHYDSEAWKLLEN